MKIKDITKANKLLNEIVSKLELPDSAYEKAKARYDDIAKWLSREGSKLENMSPYIFPQGSFRLGTAIKPFNQNGEYDVDVCCNIREGIDTSTYTQKEFKALVATEVISYASANNFKKPPQDKKRCLTLEYQDQLNFHMDIIPAIPANDMVKQEYVLSLEEAYRNAENTQNYYKTADYAILITDNTLATYNQISPHWHSSNPEGYAQWFEIQTKKEDTFYKMAFEEAKIDDIPLYTKKTTLQKVVQLLKRHRDMMYHSMPDSKPISILITTLAAQAYNGEHDLSTALINILNKMGNYISVTKPKVKNPVNPKEDFADKWYSFKHQELALEQNFYTWLSQAQRDFNKLVNSLSVDSLSKDLTASLSMSLENKILESCIIEDAAAFPMIEDAVQSFNIKKDNIAKPYCTI